jgi:hypothetical protein
MTKTDSSAGGIMDINSYFEDGKIIPYMEPEEYVRRLECLLFARVINNPVVIDEEFDDWVEEFGDMDDRTNIEAIATWVSRQGDIFIKVDKKYRVEVLEYRFRNRVQQVRSCYRGIINDLITS